ncbi:unnamed protein product [Peniophora sp. CBMAI 1063]|nr:unnamed protein product [Peniophora sp. CBMAI 1063]
MPNDKGQWRVESDASDYALGGVLSQQQPNWKWQPVAFLSKLFNDAEQNYEIYDKEMLAIMTALEEWRQYLLGTRESFEIWTDHLNLTYFREARKLHDRRQARWFTELQDYNFTLLHKPGKTMTKPDALSRDAAKNEGLHDNENVVLLKPELFRHLLLRATIIDIEGPNAVLYKRIHDSKADVDDAVVKASDADKHHKTWSRNEDGVLLKGTCMYVPRNKDLRTDIIEAHHDPPAACHPGRCKTHELISQDYFWPTMRNNIRKYVEACQTCQRVKYDRSRPAAPLHPNPTLEGPFRHVGVDFVGPVLPSEGYNMICVFTDHFTKYVIYALCHDTITGPQLASLYNKYVYSHLGLPRRIISDRGAQFINSFVRELFCLEGVESNLSTAYHPQTDGQTERQNQELETFLCIWVNSHQNDWATWLPSAQFHYNNLAHSATGISPSTALFGMPAYDGYNARLKPKVTAAGEFAAMCDKIREEIESALRDSKTRMKEQYDKHVRDAIPYARNQLVWLSAKNIKSVQPSKKLTHLYYGLP